MSYDFTTLSPEDFELLIADLFSRVFGAQLEVFKAGKDCGIDLRHSRTLPGQKQAILQCKRHSPRRYGDLLRAVKLEIPKLEKLRPERYLLVTSVNLSDHNKQDLLQVLAPWCQGTADIYSAAEVSALLRGHPQVERAHFKLWMSSTAVLERIVNARIFGVTEATVEAAKEQMSRLVIHDGFRRALEHLGTEHHVLIVGNPGIGKTTVARMLLCHYLQEGFEPVVIVGNIGDVWSMMQGSKGTERKLVVLYDDFLGQLKFESIRFGKNEELSLAAESTPKAMQVTAGTLLLVPTTLMALFWVGLATPWDATPTENRMRYLVLLLSSIAVTSGFVILSEALRQAGQRFYPSLGFATNMLAGAAYLVWTSFTLGESSTIMREHQRMRATPHDHVGEADP